MHRIFGKKETVSCVVCGKELGRHKYKPSKEWNMSGLLCADCHIDKAKEFMLKQQADQEVPDRCAICARELGPDEERRKPRWQWDMEPGSLLCVTCYEKKDADHGKKISFCALCNGKLGMFFYHPKPAWKIEGNLCRRCWDERNSRAEN